MRPRFGAPAMTPAAPHDPAARDTFGRFRPGCSGNPAGRPPGSRSEASILKEQLRGDQIDTAVQIIGDRLAAGSEAPARFVIKQIDPKKRAARITFDYPPGASVIERFQALFAAAANGEITPEEAQVLSRVLERESNTTVKAAGVARDLEHDTRADHKRAETARVAAEAAQAEADRAAAAAAEAARWTQQRAEWDAQRDAERAARQAADAAPSVAADAAPAADVPAGDPTLLFSCSNSSLAVEAAAPAAPKPPMSLH